VFVVIAMLTAAFIGLASLWRLNGLRSGGGAVAVALGGERVTGLERNPLKRRLHNVVEEMAIAAGLPVPQVYVLENEPGINAFAAGLQPADAAVAVTRGALERLSREELQGVVGHEFSHVLNGDMRLNARLMGYTFGLVAVSMLGRMMLRGGAWGGGRVRGGTRSGGGGGAAAALLAAGLAIVVLGSIGVLAGRILQAAVSRQREALADASAVQFTRNPAGLANALKRIAASPLSSTVRSVRREEIGHMLFASGRRSLAGLLATHPPVADRIRALDPSWKPGDAPPPLPPVSEPPREVPPASPARGPQRRSVAADTGVAGAGSGRRRGARRCHRPGDGRARAGSGAGTGPPGDARARRRRDDFAGAAARWQGEAACAATRGARGPPRQCLLGPGRPGGRAHRRCRAVAAAGAARHGLAGAAPIAGGASRGPAASRATPDRDRRRGQPRRGDIGRGAGDAAVAGERRPAGRRRGARDAGAARARRPRGRRRGCRRLVQRRR
jgi:Zn-dependent protease with chaperone function